MSVYKKLSLARVKLQSIKMNKSGHNKFAGFSYFEIGDFIPHINKIFDEVGLCGAISFLPEQAELWIYDTESDEKISFTSPIADATVKGCTPIQALGALHTYMRRYLWMLALEIVEHDMLDAVAGDKEPVDYKQILESAQNMTDLVNKWQTIPKNLHKSFAKVKDEMKLKLEDVA